jgi:hypothetical protein
MDYGAATHIQVQTDISERIKMRHQLLHALIRHFYPLATVMLRWAGRAPDFGRQARRSWPDVLQILYSDFVRQIC